MRTKVGRPEQPRPGGRRPQGGAEREVDRERDVLDVRRHARERERDGVNTGITGFDMQPRRSVVHVFMMVSRLVSVRGRAMMMLVVIVCGVLMHMQARQRSGAGQQRGAHEQSEDAVHGASVLHAKE
jgi:hypothetical protein